MQECDKAAESLNKVGPGKCIALGSANISTAGTAIVTWICLSIADDASCHHYLNSFLHRLAEGRKKLVEELSSLQDHLDVLVNNSG